MTTMAIHVASHSGSSGVGSTSVDVELEASSVVAYETSLEVASDVSSSADVVRPATVVVDSTSVIVVSKLDCNGQHYMQTTVFRLLRQLST